MAYRLTIIIWNKAKKLSVCGLCEAKQNCTLNKWIQNLYHMYNCILISSKTANYNVSMMFFCIWQAIYSKLNSKNRFLSTALRFINILAVTHAQTSNRVSTRLWHREPTLLGMPSPQSLEVNASVDQSTSADHWACIGSASAAEMTDIGTAWPHDEDTPTGLRVTNTKTNTIKNVTNRCRYSRKPHKNANI